MSTIKNTAYLSVKEPVVTAFTYIGNTKTKLFDGCNKVPIYINGDEPVFPEIGTIVISNDTEYIYDGSQWQSLGCSYIGSSNDKDFIVNTGVSTTEPKIIKPHHCECCGAPIKKDQYKCEYCGTEYF